MDVKDAIKITSKGVGRYHGESVNYGRADGFLDFRDQLKATGLLDAAKDVEDFLQSDDMGRQWRDEVLGKLREAVAKLSALMGENP